MDRKPRNCREAIRRYCVYRNVSGLGYEINLYWIYMSPTGGLQACEMGLRYAHIS